MTVFLNGQFLPEDQAVVSVFDRGFLYGDGLFETLRICNGRPFRWDLHWERLRRGSEFLRIPLTLTPVELRRFAGDLVAKNQMPESLLRITLSRGIGLRGYSPKGAQTPSLVMTSHPALGTNPQHPPRWNLVISSFRLPANEPLAQFKTCNKLPQVLARAEADAANADEALLLNTDGCVVEGSSSNLFWIANGTLCTPPLACGVLPGVTREVIFEVCRSLGLTAREAAVVPDELRSADGLFLSLSSIGIAEGLSLDGKPLRRSPLIERIRSAYAQLLENETSK